MIIFTSQTAPAQPPPWFHAEAWLLFRNCEMDYSALANYILKVVVLVMSDFDNLGQK